ncbi:hypothetical protein IFM89_020319 [Coptis chinensis]|uniref:Uncharacterized protein n=1 Tax=Coptis chinensis TaxID=261450 RepID=A0A835LS77_9MAGN|nr:hypothetical protein IFM89_020319 [Coptis chinensis]
MLLPWQQKEKEDAHHANWQLMNLSNSLIIMLCLIQLILVTSFLGATKDYGIEECSRRLIDPSEPTVDRYSSRVEEQNFDKKILRPLAGGRLAHHHP